MSLVKKLENNVELLIIKMNDIAQERKSLLEEFADYISQKIKDGKEINLTFICTHNSRRSHISQIWAQAAAEYYRIKNVFCYSGGTVATAFNPRAVKAMQKAGFEIVKEDESDNPVYLVKYSQDKESLKCFSKIYNNPFNPQKDYAAVMTCSDADENCPVVFGADARFPIRYNDPKEFDDTEQEEKMYAERCAQIASEMLYVFSEVKNN